MRIIADGHDGLQITLFRFATIPEQSHKFSLFGWGFVIGNHPNLVSDGEFQIIGWCKSWARAHKNSLPFLNQGQAAPVFVFMLLYSADIYGYHIIEPAEFALILNRNAAPFACVDIAVIIFYS